MSAVDVGVVTGAVFLAAFVQAIAGFGFALLAVPVMTLAISPERAVVVSTLVSVGITSWQAWFLRRHADHSITRRMVPAAYVGMPLGLIMLSVFSDDLLRLLLGVSVLVAVLLLASRLEWRGGRGLDIGAGFLSGVLNTSLSTNGPPLVFALQARRLEPAAFRATIAGVFALSNVLALALFIGAGKVSADGLRAAAFAIPALVLGQVLGFPVRRHVHGERFRRMVLVLLTAAGVSAIIGALT